MTIAGSLITITRQVITFMRSSLTVYLVSGKLERNTNELNGSFFEIIKLPITRV
jgi:hypothetical protein